MAQTAQDAADALRASGRRKPPDKENIVRGVRLVWQAVRRHRVLDLALAVILVIAIGTVGYLLFERGGSPQDQRLDVVSQLQNSVWWTIVTGTTVGYGDLTAQSLGGRLTGVFVAYSHLILMSMVTAVLASLLVERRILEGRGLQAIHLKSHLVLCGWNEHAEGFLAGVKESRGALPQVVLVSDMVQENVNEVIHRNRGELEIRFVKGDFTLESVLERANVQHARAVVVLADKSGDNTLGKADERTILATLAIKAVAPRVTVCAEILNPESEQHLRRARADEIMLRGRHTGHLLASAVVNPGVPEFLNELLNLEIGCRLMRVPAPREFLGKTFKELAAHYVEREDDIVVGLVLETRGIEMEDILSGDLSAVDLFIKEKLAEAGEEVLGATKRIRAIVNPPRGHVLKEGESLVVIRRREAVQT